MPVPILLNEPLVPPWSQPSCITPEKVVFRLLLPTVKLLAPRKTFPVPSIEPTVTPGALCPLTSRLPLPKTSTRAVPPSELASKAMRPPVPPPVPPLPISVALPAVELSTNIVAPLVNTPLSVEPLLVIVALPALEVLSKLILPPNVPPLVAPLVVMVALLAVELLVNAVAPLLSPVTVPPLLVIVAVPAVELPLNCVRPPENITPLTEKPLLLVIVALPAVELLLNTVVAPNAPLTVAPLLVIAVMLPAVALLLKDSVPKFPELSTEVTKFWVTPELLVIPTPLMVNVNVAGTVMVKGLAAAFALNTMPFTSVLADIETLVLLDEAKVAVSVGPLGAVAGVQLPGVFQSPVAGDWAHVAAAVVVTEKLSTIN